jgi:hypothetical protein
MSLKLSALTPNTLPASNDYFVMAKAGAAGDVIVKLSDLLANLPAGSIPSSALAPVHTSTNTTPGPGSTGWSSVGSAASITVPTNGTVGLVLYSVGGQFNSAPPSVSTDSRLLMDGSTVIATQRLDVGVTGATSTHFYVGFYTFSTGSHSLQLQISVSAGAWTNYFNNIAVLLLNS